MGKKPQLQNGFFWGNFLEYMFAKCESMPHTIDSELRSILTGFMSVQAFSGWCHVVKQLMWLGDLLKPHTTWYFPMKGILSFVLYLDREVRIFKCLPCLQNVIPISTERFHVLSDLIAFLIGRKEIITSCTMMGARLKQIFG